MAVITCEVVKDLLPLYVDGILSEDSRILVEEHLAACPHCKSYCEKMKDTAVPMTVKRVQSEKAAIKRILKKINKKKIRAICLTAVAVVAVAAGLFYGIMLKEIYVPYESAGLYTKNNDLYTKEPYFCCYGFGTPEEDTAFIYMTATVYERLTHRGEETLLSLFHQDPPPPSEDGSIDTIADPVINRVYYVPQEYVKLLRRGRYWFSADSEADYLAKNQERLEELKEKSVLVWKAEQETQN